MPQRKWQTPRKSVISPPSYVVSMTSWVSGICASDNNEMHIGGTDNPVIKHPVTQEPYIPGSSIKGKIRSLLEWRLGVVGVAEGQPLGFKHIPLKERPEKDQTRAKNILKLFGGAPE